LPPGQQQAYKQAVAAALGSSRGAAAGAAAKKACLVVRHACVPARFFACAPSSEGDLTNLSHALTLRVQMLRCCGVRLLVRYLWACYQSLCTPPYWACWEVWRMVSRGQGEVSASCSLLAQRRPAQPASLRWG
jgi:hypothetical protein